MYWPISYYAVVEDLNQQASEKFTEVHCRHMLEWNQHKIECGDLKGANFDRFELRIGPDRDPRLVPGTRYRYEHTSSFKYEGKDSTPMLCVGVES